MLLGITQQEYSVLLQNVRKIFIKVDLLDFLTERKMDELEGYVIDGSINIGADTNHRRSANVTFVAEDISFSVAQDMKFWVDKKIRLYIGLMDLISDKIIWFNQGKFIINNPTISYSATDNTISFEALDYMSMLDGTFGGYLQYITEIPSNINISTAIKDTVEEIAGVTKLNIERIEYDTPYTIKKESDQTIYDLLTELSELYMDWEFFFDIDGVFIFQKKRNLVNSPIVWNFEETKDLVTGVSSNFSFSNVKNVQQIWGRMLNNGTQIKHTAKNDNANHPFNIINIGERVAQPYKNDKIFTQEQAKIRALYELNERSNLNEQITIQCAPIYCLDVNRVIYFKNKKGDIEGRYSINSISIPMSYNGTMAIQAFKIYDISF